MPAQTVTRSAESDVDPDNIYNVLAEPSNLPMWAPIFAGVIENLGNGRYNLTKNGQTFPFELALHPAARAVDYLRELPSGKRGGAYLRVTPLPSGGSSVTITVPIGPSSTESDTANILDQELTDLIQLASA